MKAVAEFVMRGRSQAIGFAVITASLPFLQWLSTAAVSLVVLRKGPAEGAFVLLWTLLPMGLLFFLAGNVTPAVMLLGTVCMAYVLRTTVSWELTLLTGVLVGVVSVVLVELTSMDTLNELARLYREFLLDMQTQAAAQGQTATVEVPAQDETKALLIGVLTMGYAICMVAFLVLARWWQSILYNPGGFQEEFHQVRLSPAVAGGLVVAVLVSFSSEPLNRLVQVLTVPLMIAGLALLHWTIKAKQFSVSWLVSSYLLVVLLQLYPVLVFFALIDSWFDLRSKIQVNEV
jgi:hypothetical protein